MRRFAGRRFQHGWWRHLGAVPIPNALSQQQGADPSIAIDAGSTVYYSYVNNEPVSGANPPEGHARVVVGHRVGNTVNWTNYFDLGAGHSVRNAAEIEAVGGSSGRAAVGFLGTDRPGDYQAISFPGKWYRVHLHYLRRWPDLDHGKRNTERSGPKHEWCLATGRKPHRPQPARL